MDKELNDIEKYLKALAHKVRRDIIKALAERGSLSYTELMRVTGVMDSGTFAFHIKMLQGLIEKDPATGDYRLTDEGWRAYQALKILVSKERIEIEKSVEKGQAKEKTIVKLGELPELRFTYKLAEKLRREGKRALIRDVATLIIDDMPENLLDSVLEGIYDVDTVIVPSYLQHIVILKSKDVGYIGESEPVGYTLSESIANMVKSALATAMKGLAKAGIKPFSFIGRKIPVDIVLDERLDRPDIDLVIDTSSIKMEIADDKVSFKGEYGEGGTASLKVSDNKLSGVFDAASGILKLPRENNRIDLRIDTSSINGVIHAFNDVKANIDTSKIDLEIIGLMNTNSFFNIDTSNGSLKIHYRRFTGDSKLEFNIDTSSITIEIYVPKNIAIDASLIGGYGSIEVNGFKGKSYRDPNYPSAMARLSITVSAETSKVNVIIHREAV